MAESNVDKEKAEATSSQAVPQRNKRFSHPDPPICSTRSPSSSGQRPFRGDKKLSLPLGSHYPYFNHHHHHLLRPDAELAAAHAAARRDGDELSESISVEDEVDDVTRSLERTVRKISRGGSPGRGLFGSSAGRYGHYEVGLSGLARGYEQYRESLLTLRPATEYGEASSDDLSSEWDNSDAENNNNAPAASSAFFGLRARRAADNAYKGRSFSSPIALRLPSTASRKQGDPPPDSPLPRKPPLTRLSSEPLVEEEGDDEGEGGGEVERRTAKRKVREVDKAEDDRRDAVDDDGGAAVERPKPRVRRDRSIRSGRWRRASECESGGPSTRAGRYVAVAAAGAAVFARGTDGCGGEIKVYDRAEMGDCNAVCAYAGVPHDAGERLLISSSWRGQISPSDRFIPNYFPRIPAASQSLLMRNAGAPLSLSLSLCAYVSHAI